MQKLKSGRKPLPPEERKTKKYPISFRERDHAALKNISRKKGYSHLSDFIREYINKGIQAEERIKSLGEGNLRLKDTHPIAANRYLYWDIIWFLSQYPVIWKTEDLQHVLPEYSGEDIQKMLALMNEDEIDYIPGSGWRIRDAYEEFI